MNTKKLRYCGALGGLLAILRGDLFRGFAGLHRERFDFRGHDGKAPSCFTGARRFDCGV